MWRMSGILVVAFTLVVGVSPAQEKKEPAAKVVVEGKEVVGKVKEVNLKDKSFVLSLEDKTERAFKVNKETKFIGPRGADREEGLQDPCMSKGHEVRVVPAADDKVAKEVKLPLWKPEDEKKKKGKGG